VRLALIALAACATTPAPRPSERPSACSTAYAAYEVRWRAALLEEIADVGDAIEPAEAEEILESQVANLPSRDELEMLRAVFGIVELFLPDAAWPLAFGAADHAIAACGASAKRP
jgi:hypothetical protein